MRMHLTYHQRARMTHQRIRRDSDLIKPSDSLIGQRHLVRSHSRADGTSALALTLRISAICLTLGIEYGTENSAGMGHVVPH